MAQDIFPPRPARPTLRRPADYRARAKAIAGRFGGALDRLESRLDDARGPDDLPGHTALPDSGNGSLSVAERITRHQIGLLDAAVPSGSANLAAVLVTVMVFWRHVPLERLVPWIAAMAVAVAILIVSVHGLVPWRKSATEPAASPAARLRRHFLIATMFGTIWGAAAIAFGPELPQGPMMFFDLIVMASAAAACTALEPYLPACRGYALTSLLPLAYANFIRSEPEAEPIAVLIGLYIFVIAINVRSANRKFLATLRLQAENEVLAESLAAAKAATAKATKSKWDTIAHLSHELRTPMNAVLGFSETMLTQIFGALNDRYLDYTNHIHQSGQHALDLIDDILEVSKAEAGELILVESEVEPSALVAECVHMVAPGAEARRLTLDTRIGRALPHVKADRRKLRQVLLNLLTNAIRYTPEGGRVLIETRAAEGGLDMVVADTGIGIAEEDVDRCLEPFVRLRNPLTAGAEGTGLGLPIAKRLVEAHGGSLQITSAIGLGTTVAVHLPPERCLAA